MSNDWIQEHAAYSDIFGNAKRCHVKREALYWVLYGSLYMEAQIQVASAVCTRGWKTTSFLRIRWTQTPFETDSARSRHGHAEKKLAAGT